VKNVPKLLCVATGQSSALLEGRHNFMSRDFVDVNCSASQTTIASSNL